MDEHISQKLHIGDKRDMNDYDLILELTSLTAKLNENLNKLLKKGIELAEAEADYNMLLRRKALIEKENGIPVTFISQFIKGDTEIADKRRKRDIAEVAYKACSEAINSQKLQIKIIDAQISREWNTRDYHASN